MPKEHNMSPSAPPTVNDVNDALTVTAGDVELCRYVYSSGVAEVESPRPYIHPLRTLDGTLVSLYRPHDHVWHKGISLALPNVGPENFWGGPTYVRDKGYVGLPNNGTQLHQTFDKLGTEDGTARVDERLTWITQSGETWLDEVRRLSFAVLEDVDAWRLSFQTSLTNCRGSSIEFGSPTTEGRPNAGYAGLFWRGPRSFNNGVVLASDGPGGPEMMGERARWLAYVGRHDEIDGTSTVVFADATGNLRHPTKWFVRSDPYACVCPAPFFDEVYELPDGDTLTLSYEIVIAGTAWDADRIESVLHTIQH
jgi:Methane oxygenase PmoA